MFYLSDIFLQQFIILNTVNGLFNVYTQDRYFYCKMRCEKEEILIQKVKYDSYSALDCLSVGLFGRVLLSDIYSLTQVKYICSFTTAISRKMFILQKIL